MYIGIYTLPFHETVPFIKHLLMKSCILTYLTFKKSLRGMYYHKFHFQRRKLIHRDSSTLLHSSRVPHLEFTSLLIIKFSLISMTLPKNFVIVSHKIKTKLYKLLLNNEFDLGENFWLLIVVLNLSNVATL